MRYLVIVAVLALVSAGAAYPAILLVPSQYATIQAAVDAASTGDTVIVSPGTYLVDEIHITKGLSLRGTNTATCIIDGQLDPSIPFGTVYVDDPDGPVTIKGFTLRNSGLNSQGYSILLAARFIEEPVCIRNCHFIGHGDGDDFDLGLYVLETSGDGTFTIQENEFEDMWQAILLEIPRAGGTVCCNEIHDLLPGEDGPTLYEPEGIFALTYTLLSDGDVPNPVVIDQNSFTDFAGSCIIVGGGFPGLDPAKFTDVTIKNNYINAIGSGPERRHEGISVINYGTTPELAADAGVQNCVITGNEIHGGLLSALGDSVVTVVGGPSYGVHIWGPNDDPTIDGNVISGTDTGIAIEEKYLGAGYATGVVAHYNNITGNTMGYQNDSAVTMNAENNWWGAVDGPGLPGGTGSGDPVSTHVDFTPWLTEPSARVEVTVAFAGLFDKLIARDITFTLTTAAPVTVSTITTEVDFCSGVGETVLYGFADGVDNICICAKDRQHSLVRKATLVNPTDREYTASFTGTKALRGGDLNDDNVVDVWDYGILAAQYGTTGHPYTVILPPDADGYLYTPLLLDADIDGSGTVDKQDFLILYSNYLVKGDLRCDQTTRNTPKPTAQILCSQLAPLVGGLANAKKGDLRNDYKLNNLDVQMFYNKVRR